MSKDSDTDSENVSVIRISVSDGHDMTVQSVSLITCILSSQFPDPQQTGYSDIKYLHTYLDSAAKRL